ncbi:hypothetical protein PoB_002644400 [Plakobranchus ocellatus]|uniref:Uncharacterized protein n=1 Tax=Plakobranchus ocellatus TaxID=259542 RepID=A0AAV4A163_9GAST|nr:hypothetical protein PoB_002644400 [Plakobranchus ocellatus]
MLHSASHGSLRRRRGRRRGSRRRRKVNPSIHLDLGKIWLLVYRTSFGEGMGEGEESRYVLGSRFSSRGELASWPPTSSDGEKDDQMLDGALGSLLQAKSTTPTRAFLRHDSRAVLAWRMERRNRCGFKLGVE